MESCMNCDELPLVDGAPPNDRPPVGSCVRPEATDAPVIAVVGALGTGDDA